MPEDRLTQATDTGEHDRNDIDRRPDMLDLVSKVPFGAQVAVLAGVLVAGTGIAALISAMGGDSTTCCPPGNN